MATDAAGIWTNAPAVPIWIYLESSVHGTALRVLCGINAAVFAAITGGKLSDYFLKPLLRSKDSLIDNQHEMIVGMIHERARDMLSGEMNGSCPCLYTEPCHERCTCISPVSSSGCRRCCSYGSFEQRTAMAQLLAENDRKIS
jgi:hypothetical protein